MISGRRRLVANVAIVACLAMAVLMFASSVWNTPLSDHVVWRHLIDINHFSRRFLASLMVLIAWYLHRRRFVAWLIAVIVLTLSFALYVPHVGWVNLTMAGLQLLSLVALLASRAYFCRGGDRPSLRRGLVVFVALLVIVLVDAVIAHQMAYQTMTLAQSLGHVFNALFVTGGVRLVTKFMVVLFWVSFGVGVLLVLRPVIFSAVTSPHQRERARALVAADGQNSLSYLSLDDDKMLYFSESAPGVVAYTISGDYVVVLGDPVCEPADFPDVLRDFYLFCAAGDYRVAFLGCTGMYLDRYAALGFEWIKAGEEACFDLTEFSLAGAARAKMRSKVNGATHSGVTVAEYKPAAGRDPGIEHAIQAISDEWLRDKKTGQLTFLVGGINLHDPGQRRYFYGRDIQGRIVAIHVFLPYASGKGYVVDVTRRLASAPAGVTEKITAEAFLAFKAEGCLYASLGTAPLAHMGEADNPHPLADKALGLLYEKGNRFYGFKALRRSKNKYGPTWVPTYWVYQRGTLTPGMVMSVIKAQNPGGITDFLTGFARQFLHISHRGPGTT